MSAIGSVIVIGVLLSPAGLRHTGNLAGVHHLSEADTAQVELAVHGTRSPAAGAAGVGPHFELRLALLLLDECLLGHSRLPLRFAAEREPERAQERTPVVVGLGWCGPGFGWPRQPLVITYTHGYADDEIPGLVKASW